MSVAAVTAAGPGKLNEEIQECLARQQLRCPLQLFSASLSLHQPRLSIGASMSIGRRPYLARGSRNVPRHLYLVHRYGRIVGPGARRTRLIRSGSKRGSVNQDREARRQIMAAAHE